MATTVRPGFLKLTICMAVALLASSKHVASSRALFREGQTLLLVPQTSAREPPRQGCACSPYTLNLASAAQAPGGGWRRCFTVAYRGCGARSSSPCCSSLKERVSSLSLLGPAGPVRLQMPQQPADIRVEVNGTLWQDWEAEAKASSWHPAGARGPQGGLSFAVRLLHLEADASTLPGTTICVTAAAGQELCGGDDSAEDCWFEVSESSSRGIGSPKGLEPEAAACPVQGARRRALRADAASIARGASPRPKPSKAPRRAQRPPSPPPPPPPSAPQPPSSPKLIARSSDDAEGSGSRVCGSVTLVSPRDKQSGALKYTFGKQVSCDGMAAWMAKNLTDAAAKAGAALSVPFALESCTAAYDPAASPPVAPTLTVCGSFANVKEAAKIQDSVGRLLAQWRYLVLGMEMPSISDNVPYFCPPPGYDIVTMISGDKYELPVGFMRIQCLSSYRYDKNGKASAP